MSVVLVALLAALVPAVLCATPHVASVSAPVLAWSSKAISVDGSQVSYQASNTEELANKILLQALGKSGPEESVPIGQLSSDKSGAVVIFLGSQMDAASMRRGSNMPALTQLNEVIAAAPSSLAFPYATTKAIGCKTASADLYQDVSSVVKQASNVHVLFVCSHVDRSKDQTTSGLEEEVAQLAAVQQAVADAGAEHVFVYTCQPKASSVARRSTLSLQGFGKYTVCNGLCQTQVRWLEALLAVLVMALASCAGMTCLYLLDTPSRFETPKETLGPQ